MRRPIGNIVLALSAFGYPLTQMVIRRWGVRGACVAEAVCVGLVVRDSAMIVAGVPQRLRPGVAILLWLELGAGVAAAVAGLVPILKTRSTDEMQSRPRALEIARRAAVAMLFALHTIRFWIYLQPDRGRRPSTA